MGAIREYQSALKMAPNDKRALFEIGKTHYVLREYPQAIEALKKATETQPDNFDALLLLAKSYKFVGRYNDSIQELNRLKGFGLRGAEIDSELESLCGENDSQLFELSSFSGNFESARKYYEERLRHNPQDEKAITHLVALYNIIGDYESAERLGTEALKFVPQDNIFLGNKLLNEVEIAEGETALSSRVRRLSVTLSNKCNLSCIMCITHQVSWSIPQERLKEIFSLFPYLEKVMWQGGEVFILDYFDEILSYASQFSNLKQIIVTNGQLITEKIAEKLVKNNIELTFSIDGVTKEVYEYIRKGATFETLIRNLRSILELRKNCKSNMVLNLNVAVMKSNYHQLEMFVDFAREYGFEFVCLMPIHIHIKTEEDIFTNRDMKALTYITEVSPKMEDRARQYGIRLENRLPKLSTLGKVDRPLDKDVYSFPKGRVSPKRLCHVPWQRLLIDYDGSVRPDCLCRIERPAGSLLKNQSLEKIWNNDVMQEYRRRIVEHSHIEICNPVCLSGKIVESYLKSP